MEQLGINAGGLLAQIVNVGILLFIFMKFLYKPILKVLEKRQQSIEGNIRLQEQLEARLEALSEKEKQLLKQTRVEANKVSEEMRNQAKATAAEMLQNAREEASTFKKQAQNDVKKELEAERGKLESLVAQKATEVANTAIGKLLDEKTKNVLTEKQVRRFVKKSQS